MHWVYILLCENDHIYVGQTCRLYRRFWEHGDGRGGENTRTWEPIEILAIYRAHRLYHYKKYDESVKWLLQKNISCIPSQYHLKDFDDKDISQQDSEEVENFITERMMFHENDSNKVRGGKYVQFKYYSLPQNDHIKNLPICYCGLPCDVKKNNNKKLFFRCPRKNFWEEFHETFPESEKEPCNFYQEYDLDEQLKEKGNERRKLLSKLFKDAWWLNHISLSNKNCVGDCGRVSYTKITWNNKEIPLCFDCFIDKNDVLQQKFIYRRLLRSNC